MYSLYREIFWPNNKARRACVSYRHDDTATCWIVPTCSLFEQLAMNYDDTKLAKYYYLVF